MAVTKAELEEFHSLIHRHHELVDAGEAWLAERKQNFDDIDNRLNTLEAKAGRPSLFSGSSADDEYDLDELQEMRERKRANKRRAKAFRSLMKSGMHLRNISGEDRGNIVPFYAKDGEVNVKSLDLKALNLTDDTLGGYFVLPEIVQDEIVRNVVLISPIRGAARVQQTSANNLKIPVLTSPTAAAWISETGTRTVSSNPQFGMKDIPTHECYALMLFSRQLLEDSFFDMEKEMAFEFSQQFAKLEGTAFVSGSGVGQPLGLLNDPNTSAFTTASSATLVADDLIGAVHNFPSFAYYMQNAQWVMNLSTLGTIRKFKDSQNRYLWEPGLSLADPPMILNMKYIIAPDMPSIAAGANALAFGDFNRGYRIVDRTQIAVQRLEELYATSAQIGVLAYKRVGAQTVLSEAIHPITIHS